jgi:hypothetical protein
MTSQSFLNQRPRFRNLSPPYAVKSLDDPRGQFPSRKNSRQIAFWNLRELNFIKLAESSTAILSYEERPELIMMRSGPAWYGYVPHFRVVLPSGPVFVELSHEGKPSTPKQTTVATLARAKFAADHQRFVELSHTEVRARPRLSNASLLLRYLSTVVGEEQALHARDVLARGPASMREVEAAAGVSHSRLLKMALRGDLGLDTRSPITRDSLLSLSSEGERA